MFFECSDSIAATSRAVADSVKSGAAKKSEKRASAPGSAPAPTSKK